MSKLIHLCECGHSEHWHSERNGGYTLCTCCRNEPVPSRLDPEPTLRETYSLTTGQPEPLAEPGTMWNGGTNHRESLCCCAACLTRYAAEVSS